MDPPKPTPYVVQYCSQSSHLCDPDGYARYQLNALPCLADRSLGRRTRIVGSNMASTERFTWQDWGQIRIEQGMIAKTSCHGAKNIVNNLESCDAEGPCDRDCGCWLPQAWQPHAHSIVGIFVQERRIRAGGAATAGNLLLIECRTTGDLSSAVDRSETKHGILRPFRSVRLRSSAIARASGCASL